MPSARSSADEPRHQALKSYHVPFFLLLNMFVNEKRKEKENTDWNYDLQMSYTFFSNDFLHF